MKFVQVEKEIDTQRKQEEKQIMTSMIMSCINEPFSIYFNAEKSSETFAFFSSAENETICKYKEILD